MFDYDTYRDAGEYEVRYFYGDNPSVPGSYHWLGQGYVCHAWMPLSLGEPTDPGAAGWNRLIQDDLGSTSGNGDTRVDPNAMSGAVPGQITTEGPYGAVDIQHDGMHRGVQGMAKVAALSLQDCQCDPATVESTLSIVQASYGNNCQDNGGQSHPLGPTWNNLLQLIGDHCNDHSSCTFPIEHAVTGDPAPWCHKDLKVDYLCSGAYTPCEYVIANQDDPIRLTECRHIIPDAEGKNLTLQCPQAAARDHCLAKRAACGRCALDAVVTASTMVVSRAEGETNMYNEYTAWQDTESIPGFEVGIN